MIDVSDDAEVANPLSWVISGHEPHSRSKAIARFNRSV
jgi:hypothetical protein